MPRDAVVDRLVRSAEPTMSEKRGRTLEVVGKYHSGLKDLGRNHDRYLAEGYSQCALAIDAHFVEQGFDAVPQAR